MDNIDNMNDYGTTQYERSGTTSTAHDKDAGVRTYRPNRPMGGSHKSFKDSSPEEIQQLVSEKVAKAVAAAAGAVEGFANQMKESRVAENARDAITSVGETASTIVGTSRKQFHSTKEALTGDIEQWEDSVGSGGSSGSSGGESYGGPSYEDDTANSSGTEIGGSGKGGNKLGKGMDTLGKGTTTGKKAGGGNVGF